MRARFVEEDLAALAQRQHGVVARRQLLTLGLGAAALGRRLEAGRLHRAHAGVYAVGHPLLGVDGRWMTAVLACGPDPALGYASAAAFLDLRRGVPSVIDVVAPSAGGRARRGCGSTAIPG